VFDNIFNTVMDMKRETENNKKVRMDVALYCHHENIKLVIDEFRIIKPKATFVLDKDASLFVYE
jgi:hypothetical protein